MKQDVYTFPAIFNYAEDGISIFFPDFPGCFSCAHENGKAVVMASDALGLRIYIDESTFTKIPEPSDVLEIKKNLEDNQIITLIRIPMKQARQHYNLKGSKKHSVFSHDKKPGKVTIPLDVDVLPEFLVNKILEFTGLNFHKENLS